MANENLMTPEFRVSYPAVFRAKKNDLNGKDEYNVVALFKKGEDLSKLKAAAEKAICDKWGSDKAKWPKNLRSPFRDQGEKEGAGYEEGAVFMNLKSNQKPGLVNAQVEDIIDESEFYSGCYARATVSCYAYDQAGNRGVSFGLQNIQKLRDGDPLGGSRPKAQNEFAPVESGGSSGGLFD